MDQRAVARQPVEFTARCCSNGQATGCRLLNISPHGCLIEVEEAILGEGNPLRIRIPGLASLDGKIAWHDGLDAGVAFAVALHPAVVSYIAGFLDAEETERGFPPLTSTR